MYVYTYKTLVVHIRVKFKELRRNIKFVDWPEQSININFAQSYINDIKSHTCSIILSVIER